MSDTILSCIVVDFVVIIMLQKKVKELKNKKGRETRKQLRK